MAPDLSEVAVGIPRENVVVDGGSADVTVEVARAG